MAEIIIAKTKEEYNAAAELFRQYVNWLNIDLSFQHFDKEMKKLEIMYGPPSGAIVLYKHKNIYTGCVGIRALNNETAELKRMYVIPRHQHTGVGKLLLSQALMIAKDLGYKSIRLDTLSTMKPAINLYKKYEFVEIPSYYNNLNETAVFFERLL